MKRRRLKKKPFIVLVFFIGILFIFTFNASTSRYLGQINASGEDVLAVPVISLSNPTFEHSPTNMLPGDTTETNFYVSNYVGENINELLMKYYFKITKIGTIPVEITILDELGNELCVDDEGRTTEEVNLTYDNNVSTEYTIRMEWDEKYNDYKYAGQNLKIKVDLIATQVIEE